MKSESIKEITIALAKAQIAFKPIKRTEKVDYPTAGGRKNYNYAPLSEVIEATKEALSTNGLAITQSTKLVGEHTVLETLLSHSSGEWLSGELYVGRQDQAPQAEGSALTYKRRYGMSAMLCVSSEEDDDAEGAGKEDVKVSSPTIKKTIPKPLTPQELYELALKQETGADLCKFAMKNGWTKERLQKTLGIVKSADIIDVRTAAVVLFPKEVQPSKNKLIEEAKKLGAIEIKEGG